MDSGQGSSGQGIVEGIFVTSAAGAPCEALGSAEAKAGAGLVGDRYSVSEGTYSERGGPGRQLTLITSLAGTTAGLAPGESRRNIETSGIDLLSLIGRRFAIGPVECIGVRDCPPCAHLEALTSDGVKAKLEGTGGLRADILASGTITVGDSIRVLD
jgi:MOSC domain-containing protein YiiM